MIYPAVKSLFKYHWLTRIAPDNSIKFNTDLVSCINSKSGWFSDPRAFNDPFDCSLDSIVPSHYDDRDHMALSQVLADHVSLQIRHQIQRYGVLSLTERADNILMWSHYANGHTGICIEYERTDDNILGDDSVTRPVRYTDVYPLISYDDAHHLAESKPKFLDDAVLSSYFYTKSSQWSYEQEWRTVSAVHGPQKRGLELTGVRIRSISFGLGALADHKRWLRESLHSTSISFKRAVKGKGRFDISFEDETWA